jgi:hypothetical protein
VGQFKDAKADFKSLATPYISIKHVKREKVLLATRTTTRGIRPRTDKLLMSSVSVAELMIAETVVRLAISFKIVLNLRHDC